MIFIAYIVEELTTDPVGPIKTGPGSKRRGRGGNSSKTAGKKEIRSGSSQPKRATGKSAAGTAPDTESIPEVAPRVKTPQPMPAAVRKMVKVMGNPDMHQIDLVS